MDALATRRRKATLHFNAKGKYIQQAEEQRKEAKMEELRQRIAEQSRKAGLDSEFDVLERNIKRQPPPEIEWWDAPLLKNANYNDLDMGEEGKLVRSDDSLVTIYVQHPVPLPPPFEGKAEEPRGLMLTKKVRHDVRVDRSIRIEIDVLSSRLIITGAKEDAKTTTSSGIEGQARSTTTRLASYGSAQG
jgi:U4/U6 small nuclear ribonucleoprotein PRP3